MCLLRRSTIDERHPIAHGFVRDSSRADLASSPNVIDVVVADYAGARVMEKLPVQDGMR